MTTKMKMLRCSPVLLVWPSPVLADPFAMRVSGDGATLPVGADTGPLAELTYSDGPGHSSTAEMRPTCGPRRPWYRSR